MYPVGRSRFQAALLLGLWCAGLAVATFWGASRSHLDWRTGLVILALITSGLAARSSWNKAPTGHLGWDGQAWRWEDVRYPTGLANRHISLMADFQSSILLRMQTENDTRWLWLEKNSMPERWMDFRRALYSPRPDTASDINGSAALGAPTDSEADNPLYRS
ncbi:MAG: hypothetical protein JWP47_1458 [Polaromonas sp.]|jgi:toxin CptA|nr:hypothetical protein [Polaromonas sp.]